MLQASDLHSSLREELNVRVRRNARDALE